MATEKEKRLKDAKYLAESLFGDFANTYNFEVAIMPDVFVEVGKLVDVTYSVFEDAEEVHYKHTFENERPILVTSHNGEGLFIIGGNFKVSEQGIEG